MVKNLATVIIPTYNREKTILRTIKSVLNQTYGNFELLVIDDGSTDNTKEIITQIDDKRISYFFQENKGQNSARNKGLKESHGEFIFFLDSDDEWLSIMLEEHIKIYNSQPDTFCVYNQVIAFNDYLVHYVSHYTLSGSIYSESLKQGYISTMISISIRTNCLSKITGFDENFSNCDDDEFCLHLAKYFKFYLVDKILAIIHNDGENRVTSDKTEFMDGMFNLYKKYYIDILELCGEEEIISKFNNLRQRYESINNSDGINNCNMIIKSIPPQIKGKHINFIKYLKKLFKLITPPIIIIIIKKNINRFK